MGDITLGISPACKLIIFHSFLLNHFQLLLTRWLVACTDRGSGSHHVLEGCSPNEDYVATLLRKLVEWYRDCSTREGRAPPPGNDGVDDKLVEDWVGEGGIR